MREQLVKISPSILAINFNDDEVLKKSISDIENADANFVHIDVMDGRFVPNYTFNHKLISKVKKMTNLILDVHLMVENPENVVEDYAKAGADILTVHYEACKDKNLPNILTEMKKYNVLVGIAINPDTSVMKIKRLLEENLVDMVTVMSVVPGAGGQSFIPKTAEKIAEIKQINKRIMVEVDGGVNEKNAPILRKLGADVLVSGSCIFKSSDMKKTIQNLKGDSFLNSLRNNDCF